ncbi:MAG: hypothetical protein V3U82_00895 [Robiginitomaculum sp.]
MSSNLFRKQAAGRSRALYGDVVLRGSVSSWLITALLAALALLIVGVLFLGRIESGGESLSIWGYLWGLSG